MSFDASHTAGTLEALAASLGAMESDCGSVVEELSHQFQSLANGVSELLRLAGLAAATIEAGAICSIPAKVETLVACAESFVSERLSANSAVSDVVRSEQELIHALMRVHASHGSVAQQIRLLTVLTGMEIARLDDAGSGFRYLVRELYAAADTVASAAREFSARAGSRNRAIDGMQRRMAFSLPRLRKQFQVIGKQLQQGLLDVRVSVEELSACPAEFKACVETVAARISGVVAAIQSHDITRQQNEHVRDALAGMASLLRAEGSEPNPEEIALMLRVQTLQLENIRQTMSAWSAQIDACLESILEVSQSRLERVAPMVLGHEKQLFQRLVEIESIEKECQNDSVEVEEAFSGLSSLLALVSDNSQTSRITRDRLKLLSFNSVIESRNLGGKTGVMLEISRNITRIASEWGDIAQESASIQAEIQQLMDQAQAAIGVLTRNEHHELRAARLDIVSALDELRGAAQSNVANAASMGTLTALLHAQIDSARSLSRSLRAATMQMGRSIEELEALEAGMQVSAAGQTCDLAALEAAYSATYTTEIERGILRAALYGQALPTGAAEMAGNDVELF